MATAEQIKALIQSHFAGDEHRFHAIAMQVAAHSARQGHGKVASEIRKLVDEAKSESSRPSAPIPIATPQGELAALLAVSYPDIRLNDMVLADDIRSRLQRLLREQHGRDRLQAFGLQPRSKLLLLGPPGSGKTMTASALAGELHLPLYVILLHGLITKFMGETAAKLRLVFDSLADRRGVYLFDEFDAIGGERAATNDVGEIRRVLNSFLQFLEQDDSTSLVVAATNHPQSLDRALFRRFDDVIRYQNPPQDLAAQALHNKLSAFDTSAVAWDEATAAARGLSYADITTACENAAKEAVLSGQVKVTTPSLVEALRERHQASNE